MSFALHYPEFPSCSPESTLMGSSPRGELPSDYCAIWNPDFSHNGQKCCGKVVHGRKARRNNQCSPKRVKSGYCNEMTSEQAKYIEEVKQGKLVSVLDQIQNGIHKKTEQAFCSVNNGFLVNGRPVVSTNVNKIVVKSPERCLFFGTDPMVGMLEWLGREVSDTYPKVRLVIGDISGPRGGCLFGRSGKRGHASHTSGQDGDVGFLHDETNIENLTKFTHSFEPSKNWWFLKKVFKNPFACVKVIFLDRQHIHSLTRFAKKDPEWNALHRFIRHMPGHKNHFHIRVGKGPGVPGCGPDAKPELEVEEDFEMSDDSDENAAILEELKSRF